MGSDGDSASKSEVSSLPPVYDKPVYDDDAFDGVPGLKSMTKVSFDIAFACPKTKSVGSGREGLNKEDKVVSIFNNLLLDSEGVDHRLVTGILLVLVCLQNRLSVQ